jgi:hypothetical protein
MIHTTGELLSKISANDSFDDSLFIRGVVHQLLHMYSNVYEFRYYFTFKKTRKRFSKEYHNPYKMSIFEEQFYLDTGDLVVRNCCSVLRKISVLKGQLMTSFAIDEMENMRDKVAEIQAKRYAPYRLIFKKSKSYKKLKVYYERSLLEYINYLYKVASVITCSNYRIPKVFGKQFLLENAVSLRLLNIDNDVVAAIKEVIEGLRKDLADLRSL